MSEINFSEYSVIKCKGCAKECKRYRAGKYSNGKDTRYVDEQGKEFNGHTCPHCHKNKVSQRKRLNNEIIKKAKELINE